MRQLFVARHGMTASNAANRFVSFSDEPLIDEGRLQADALARDLASVDLETILTSPSGRARETANAVASAQRRRVAVEVDPLLAEVGLGRFEGQTRAELAGEPLGDELARWEGGGAGGDAEALEEAQRRAADAFRRALSVGASTLVVTHGVFARVLIATCVLGMPASAYRRLRLENGGLARVIWDDGFPRLVYLGRPAARA